MIRSFPSSPFPPAALLLAATALGLAGCSADPGSEAAFVPPTQVAAVHTPAPDYPIELACAGIGGVVGLSLTVGTDGKPAQIQLRNSSGNGALDQAAQEAVKSWKFEAATRGGKPLPQTIQVPVNFKPPQPRPDQCFALDAKSR